MAKGILGRAGRTVAGALLCFTGCGAAQAALVSGNVTGGSALGTGSVIVLEGGAVPAAVGDDNFDTNNLYILPERQDVTLTQALVLDDGGTIPIGTMVSSFLVIFDPFEKETLAGTLNFTQTLLGVDTRPVTINATNALFARPGVTYLKPSGFALETTGDDLVLHSPVANALQITVITSKSPGDMFRVFTLSTAPIPEPMSWTMMIAGFLAAGAILRARHIQAATA
jgi:hypothetical protein